MLAAAKEAGAKIEAAPGDKGIVCQIDDIGADIKAASAAVEAVAKKYPELPICVVAPSTDKMACITQVPKGSGVDAKAWIQTLWPICNGAGGGNATKAQGTGKDVTKITEVLAAAKAFLN